MAATTKPAASANTAGKPAPKSKAKTNVATPSTEVTALAQAVAPKKSPNQINTVAAYKAYTDDDATRVDGWAMRWEVIEEEEGFNPRDYDDPELVAHIRKMADAYKRGEVFPHLWVVVRNGTVYVRDGHCRLRAIKLAVSEGAKIGKVPVIEVKGDEIAQADVVLISQDGFKLKPLERAAQYVKYHNWGMNDAEIGKRFNMTGEHVRLYRSMLELPIALKKLITEGTITPTLALDLYKQYGSDSVGLVNQAVEIQRAELDAEAEKATTAAMAALLTGDLLQAVESTEPVSAVVESPSAVAQLSPDAAEAGAVAGAEAGAAEVAPATVTPEQPKASAKPKVMKKHIDRLVGAAPKLSKQVVASMTRTFSGLSSRIESVRMIDDKLFIEVSADDLELLKQLKAQMAAPADVPPTDPNQMSMLDNASTEEESAA